MKTLILVPMVALFTVLGCTSPADDGDDAYDSAYTAGQAPATAAAQAASRKAAMHTARAKTAKALFDGFNKGADPNNLSDWPKVLKDNCGDRIVNGVPLKVWIPDANTAEVLRVANYSSTQVLYTEVPVGNNKLDIKFITVDQTNMQDNICSSDTHVAALTCLGVTIGQHLTKAQCGL